MRALLALLLTTVTASAEVPRVVTDIPPVHSIVAGVMGNLGTPDLLLSAGMSEHDFQLKPSQVGALAEAGLVVWVGPELTPWLETALDARGGTGAVLGLFDDVGTYKINYFVSGDATETANPAEADHGEAEHDHGAGSIDPHVWLDPSTAQYWTGLIAAELSRLDPENAATYAANAEATAAAIALADAEAKALLAPVKDRPFVAFHDAYGYFVNYYGLNMTGTVALGDAASPGAQRLVSLQEQIKAEQVACLFPEVQHDPALIAQLSEATGVAVGAPLDPVGAGMQPGADLYPALLVSLAKTIAACAP